MLSASSSWRALRSRAIMLSGEHPFCRPGPSTPGSGLPLVPSQACSRGGDNHSGVGTCPLAAAVLTKTLGVDPFVSDTHSTLAFVFVRVVVHSILDRTLKRNHMAGEDEEAISLFHDAGFNALGHIQLFKRLGPTSPGRPAAYGNQAPHTRTPISLISTTAMLKATQPHNNRIGSQKSMVLVLIRLAKRPKADLPAISSNLGLSASNC